MTTTPNLGLNKPDNSDPIDIRDLNENADILDAAVSGKQDALTFDSVPTQGSTNPVESGGVYTPLAEDRAALVELVDGGAKNLIDVNLKNITGSYWDIPIKEIPAGTYVVSLGSLTSTDTDATTCNVRFGKSGSGIFGSNQCERGTNVYVTITNDNPADYLRIYYSDTNTHSSGDSITATDLMVCTKAAWDISHEFVPYCPSMSEMYSMILALQSGTRSAPALAKAEPEPEEPEEVR